MLTNHFLFTAKSIEKAVAAVVDKDVLNAVLAFFAVEQPEIHISPTVIGLPFFDAVRQSTRFTYYITYFLIDRFIYCFSRCSGSASGFG